MQNHNSHFDDSINILCEEFKQNNQLDPSSSKSLDVKRGLRNADGTGVMAGVTLIGSVQGYIIVDEEKTPMEGKLIYRGYDMADLIAGLNGSFGYEEIAYLLLCGALPTKSQYEWFKELLAEYRNLPDGFTEDMIIKAPSADIMNKLARSVLVLYSYDENPDDTSLKNMLRQSIGLIAKFPTIVAHAYSVKRHYFDNKSLFLHRPSPELSLSENFLRLVRPDMKFTEEEARLLDLCLIVHAEHGGGNNSAFACRVVSSSGTDTYSAISAAVGSLKGPKHGGANKKVMEMYQEIETNVKDWNDDAELTAYLKKILKKEAGDGSGLIYGMGHAIYTISDPRAVILKDAARSLAVKRGLEDELKLFESVERLAPSLLTDKRASSCANVDMYSGLVYKMLGIPSDLYTPLFAIARVVGWCAHRIEEAMTGGRIIRPAYKAVSPMKNYIPMDER